MTAPLRIFIGYDSREPVAYHVLSHSILARASGPVAITPLVQTQLRHAGLYARERNPLESTEFSLTRFLVPYLSGYQGVSIFMDCDMLCQEDIYELVPTRGERAVWVAQHDYLPKPGLKMDGKRQTSYERKNWSSLMIFNNERCRFLTPDYVNIASPLSLHRFHWLYCTVCRERSAVGTSEGCWHGGDDEIGSIPLSWNWLVGEYEPNRTADILHYTLGGPWFPECVGCDHADLWLRERDLMLGVAR